MTEFNMSDGDGQIELKLSRGGARKGSGRKPIGVTKTIKLTLTPYVWRILEMHGASPSEAIRNIIEDWRGNPLTNEDGSPVENKNDREGV